MPRTLEFIVAGVALAILSIPIAVTALVVRVTLGRPLLFSQWRAGKDAKPFSIRKFRTMTDMRDATGVLLPDAARQTPATRGLRRLRLDELPQLFSILVGDMALIGPRPLLPETIAAFGEAGALRCAVRPGMTGWSQVSGNTRLTNAQKLQLDLWYVANRSFALDLRILCETVLVVIGGERRREGRIDRARDWFAASGIAGSEALIGKTS